MIGFFPALYEDELFYSWIARYMAYSGYTSIADAYVDIYNNKMISPSIELMNNLSLEATRIITKYKPLEQLIIENTMFPEYGRFITPSKRVRLLSECDFTIGNWSNTLQFPKVDEDRRLKYCPECVKEDRECYGETYWHRVHQIFGIRICKKHRTLLLDSTAVIKYNNTRLKNAEIIIPEENISEICGDETIMSLAVYLEKVFYDDRYSHNRIGLFLNDSLDDIYIYKNGNRKLYALYDAYNLYYASLKEKERMTIDFMSKLLRGTKGAYYYICQMALFEGIGVDDLLEYQSETDEKRIFRIVAEKTNEPIEVVEKIGVSILDEYKNHGGKMIKEMWYQQKLEEDDRRLVEDVKIICNEIYGYENKRPKKVTVKTVSRILGIDPHRMTKMPLCMEMINRYNETQERYWAREIVWAVKMIDSSNNILNYNHIRKLINLKPNNIKDSLDDLMIIDEFVYNKVKDLL